MRRVARECIGAIAVRVTRKGVTRECIDATA